MLLLEPRLKVKMEVGQCIFTMVAARELRPSIDRYGLITCSHVLNEQGTGNKYFKPIELKN